MITSDLRFAARTLIKSPGFALVAILSLALGIGANTAIFSLMDAVVLRMLPVKHPEQLMRISTNAVQSGNLRISRVITLGAMHEMQRNSKTASGFFAADNVAKLVVAIGGETEVLPGQFVTGGYYSELGVGAAIGRTIEARDDQPDGRVAMLSYGYWQRKFGADPGVIGRAIAVNNVPFTIVGVTQRDFHGTSLDAPPDLTVPTGTRVEVDEGKPSGKTKKESEGVGWVYARLRPGVSRQQAATEMTGMFRAVALADAKDNKQRESIQMSWLELEPAGQGLSHLRSRFEDPLRVLMGVVGLVMLIACANIANLLLARATARQREIAIRMSLGSTRWRLVRQLLTESLLLSGLGGALGVLFAAWARDGIVALANVDGEFAAPWNWRVLGFTAGVCVVNALLFGIAPALRATRVDFAETLKAARSARMGGRLPLARLLVAAQVALSLALLVGSALFLQTFLNLNHVDLGYDRGHELMITLDPSTAGYSGPGAKEIFKRVFERTSALPGVRSVSVMTTRPMSGMLSLNTIHVPGYTPKQGEDPQNMFVIANLVGPRFLSTAGMKLISGRDINEQDNENAPHIAVINETMAKHFFAGRDPIGLQITEGPKDPPLTIVGVVHDFRIFGMQEGDQDAMFSPFLQGKAGGAATLLVRTAGDPTRVASDVRAVIHSVDAKLPVYDVSTMDQQVSKTLSEPRMLAVLVSVFGALAMGLAVIGLYGVLSYGVTQRTGEIGVRMALGALPAAILRMILRETVLLVAIGIVVGVAVALGAGKTISSQLYGIKATSAWPIVIAVVVLSSAALLAGFLPARRASRVDPMVALRDE